MPNENNRHECTKYQDNHTIFRNKLSFEINEWQRAVCKDDCLLRNFAFSKLSCSSPLPQKHTFKTHLNIVMELKNKHPDSSSEIPKKKRYTHYLFIFVLKFWNDGRMYEKKSTLLCVLDRASSWYLNKGWPTRWHLLYYILLNMFQSLIRPSSGASEYLLCCVGW